MIIGRLLTTATRLLSRLSAVLALYCAAADHAGIATQMVVEKQLAAQGKDRREMGREAFEKEVRGAVQLMDWVARPRLAPSFQGCSSILRSAL